MMLLRALHAEALKLKHTLAFRMVFVAPLLVATLQFFIAWNQKRVPADFKFWDTMSQNGFSVWAIFMLPLLITLETALLNGLEHSEKQWKHLFALPVPRYAIYAAKLLMAQALVLLSSLVLSALIVLTGFALMRLRAEYGIAGAPPYGSIVKSALLVWLASGLIIAIHTWISARWASFTLALGAGIGGTFFALFAASANVGKFYPWLLPVNAIGLIQGGDRFKWAMWLGCAGGVVAAVLGCLEFIRADESETPALSRKTLLRGSAALALVAVLGLVVLKFKPRPDLFAERIARVESGLLTSVSLKGETAGLKLADRMAFYHVPGVSIAVINDGKIEWVKGYGVIEAATNQPVTIETRFQAASISKPVTAVAALALVQQGKLQLDEDVNAKLAAWKVPENEFTRTQKVTLRRLLSHTAGVVENKYPGYEANRALPTALQVLDGLPPATTKPIRVEREPGSAFLYSGGGYLITQQLLSDVTGKPFPDLMNELVLSKLGMQHSTFTLPSAWESFAARAHNNEGQLIKGRWYVNPELAAAGLWTTPSDLARFAMALWQSHRGQASNVLTPDLTRQMMTKQRNNYGLGLLLGGKDKLVSFNHEGSNMGYKCAMVMYLDTGQGAVVMTNGEQGGNLMGEIMRGLALEYGWPNYRLAERTPVQISPAVYANYIGRYETDHAGAQSDITVLTENGKLYFQVATLNGQKIELYPLADDRFFMLEEDAEISFVKDARGVVVALRAQTADEDVTAKRLP